MEVFRLFSSLCLLSLLLLTSAEGVRRRTYIVHVQPPESAALGASSDRESWYRSFLATVSSEVQMIYMYTNVISGFAARLTELELEAMSVMPGFVRAYPDRMYRLQTTHTPAFLGLLMHQGLWNASNYGKGIIIGVLDTGIFPDHPSFSGLGMPPPPAKWRGRCDFNASSCNNKLIGARSFISGAMAMKGQAVASESPIDDDGHGTHTASTAAGAAVPGAEVLGNAKGMAIGMAPLAHVAMYKVCGETDCASSDILAGMDAAVADGADVLSLSLGGPSLPFDEDTIAVGAFGAIEKGVFVSCAAGNSGPVSSTLSNEAPWILTVAASTMDRNIRVTVMLGNGLSFDGESIFQPNSFPPALYPVVYAGANGSPATAQCANGSFDGFDVKGKIVLCDRGGGIARLEKGATVLSAGGIGMILANQATDGYSTLADAHVLPASHVSFAAGDQIKAFINSSSNPTAALLFKGTVLGTSPAPAITSFSSRGPSLASPGILKPDITGPGVSVLAAWPFRVGPPSNYTGTTFNIISGTSMSTPHLSGIAALVKSARPDWSPAAIKSAIMTTASVVDHSGKPIVNEQLLQADLFAIGAGHVNPVKASNPGLVYDLSADDYIAYLCGLGYASEQVSVIARRTIDCSAVSSIPEKDLNYPSISVSLGGNTTYVVVERRVKNVGKAASTYWAEVGAPYGTYVRVHPPVLRFNYVNQEKRFFVAFKMVGGGGGGWQGYLKWVSVNHEVRSPISITYKN
ncbi:hypothetical protein OPV22_002169 [Ensete ventricosum]|uniref:Subtilisin-like protease SBT1.2 n=1 Tax=Ensete ventricosum TaxID=4639 RepID=A0AAV8RX84_ENSVE|nr:hypothetical protein OPV22_002169 [Ensete ventricosum]RZR91058.1 hypothetical protein BHM03_00019096 [Ensete ventricosum]